MIKLFVLLLMILIIFNIFYNYSYEPFNNYIKRMKRIKKISKSQKKFKDELINVLERTPDPGKMVVDYYVDKYYWKCKGRTALRDFGCTNLTNNMYNNYGYSFENDLI